MGEVPLAVVCVEEVKRLTPVMEGRSHGETVLRTLAE
jgi:hypothetical protein